MLFPLLKKNGEVNAPWKRNNDRFDYKHSDNNNPLRRVLIALFSEMYENAHIFIVDRRNNMY